MQANDDNKINNLAHKDHVYNMNQVTNMNLIN